MTAGQRRHGISAIHRLGARGAWVPLAIFVLAAFGTLPALAQAYTVLHRFTGSDGSYPQAGLIADLSGNLYGTTLRGGASDYGAVFKLSEAGLTVLYSFTFGADGGYPSAGVIRDSAGNLYGTTQFAGASGYGTVFKIDAAGAETVLHSFTGERDGGIPYAGLIQDSAGNLYGTTTVGGARRQGTVFKLDKAGETVLYSFTGGYDGMAPYAGLIQDAAGNLYGTTTGGGISGKSGFGVVFKLDTAGNETVLHRFTGGADGAYPSGGLIRDWAGNLYGTTTYGGSAAGLSGYGVVFKLDAAGRETVLYTFTGGADGGNPYAGLLQDSAGNLYGTTLYGGTAAGPTGLGGVVFKLDTTGKETALYNLAGAADGALPYAGLLRGLTGRLYGTAAYGGFNNYAECLSGCGVVFQIAP